MNSEIEKLYKNAKVKEVLQCNSNMSRCTMVCEGCQYLFNGLPPFTAEKQLSLIKWLARNKDGLGIDFYGSWEVGVKFEWEAYKYTQENDSFEEALAKLVNNLWQDLADTEKQQLKEILEK